MLRIGSRRPPELAGFGYCCLGWARNWLITSIVPLAIKGINVGIGQQYEGCGKLIYQGGGTGNFIGIAVTVAVLWPSQRLAVQREM